MQIDYQTRMDSLEKRLSNARFEGERLKIQAEIEQLKGAYSQAFERLDSALKAAEAVEKAQASEKEAKRVAQELEVKARALKEWERAGGDPQRFEESWVTIREAVLNERVISSLTDREVSRSSRPFTL
ncbi:MAG: hypothetical protein GX491_07105 [Chloroflexi bacterium]|nr:hypothetical protein [Chloroflexota bacterium]